MILEEGSMTHPWLKHFNILVNAYGCKKMNDGYRHDGAVQSGGNTSRSFMGSGGWRVTLFVK